MGDSRWAGGIFPLREYRIARDALLAWKREQFPIPCVVRVDSGSLKTVGIAYGGFASNADELPVYLESKNTWTYPLEHCTRITDESQWPTWVRDEIEGRK